MHKMSNRRDWFFAYINNQHVQMDRDENYTLPKKERKDKSKAANV